MKKYKLERIYKYGEEVLKKVAEEITEFDDSLKELVNDMRLFMYESDGVGLAAPQVGISKALAVVDISCGEEEEEFLPLINPIILDSSGLEEGLEGCLSLPTLEFKIKRANKIKLRRFSLEGEEIIEEYEGFKARAIQHEMDHLIGKLLLDRVSPLNKQIALKKIKKLKKNNEW